jgi:hypothetical protein
MSEYWYQRQMMCWIEYAEEHRFDKDHRKLQTQGLRLSERTRRDQNPKTIGNTKRKWQRGPMEDIHLPTTSMKWVPLNTWTLYKAWTKWTETRPPTRRIYVPYDEAVIELHAYLDFLKDAEVNFVEDFE